MKALWKQYFAFFEYKIFLKFIFKDSTCTTDESQGYLKNYIFFLLAGQLFNGYGGTCLLSVGVTYLDQSVPSKTAGFYIGKN